MTQSINVSFLWARSSWGGTTASLLLSLWGLCFYTDKESHCWGLCCHIPFSLEMVMKAWMFSRGTDTCKGSGWVLKGGTSLQLRKAGQSQGAPLQRQRAKQNTDLESQDSSLFSAICLLWRLAWVRKENMNVISCWVLLRILSQAFGTPPWGGSMFYVRCRWWVMPFITCVAFRLSVSLLIAINKWLWISRDRKSSLFV